MTPDEVVEQIVEFFRARGELHYGEAVTQREHALQTALLAQRAGEPASFVIACLLHDVGHLLPARLSLPGPTDVSVEVETTPDDDLFHEEQGARWLRAYFPEEITQPIRLHVAAKRYLCWKDPSYHEGLSPASQQSLRLQGGPMTSQEASQFASHPHHEAALRLRWFDDQGKIPEMELPPLEDYVAEIRQWVRFS